MLSSSYSISANNLWNAIATPSVPQLVDVRGRDHRGGRRRHPQSVGLVRTKCAVRQIDRNALGPHALVRHLIIAHDLFRNPVTAFRDHAR
jgi:hypothetical protein